jgi:hypothetical protein
MPAKRFHKARPALLAAAVILAGIFFSPELRYRASPDSATGAALCAREATEGEKNLFRLQELYVKWNEGLFGSRRYYERKLWSFLVSLMGKEITTGHDFMLASPEGIFDKRVVCIFPSYRWLYIHGELNEESAKSVAGGDYAALKGWWRSGKLVAVTGKIKIFKLDWDAQGDVIHLYLDKVTMLYEEGKK